MLRDEGHVAHVQHNTFGSGTKDVDWLPEVGSRRWILITKDKQIRKREIELRALRQAGVRAFVLTSAGLTGESAAPSHNRSVFQDDHLAPQFCQPETDGVAVALWFRPGE